MSRIATVRPVGHIGQRNVRRRVGPTQVAHLRFVTSVDPTEARNARQEKSGESICEELARW